MRTGREHDFDQRRRHGHDDCGAVDVAGRLRRRSLRPCGSAVRLDLNAGLLDEVRVNLVPVLLGEGIRYFDNLSNAPVALEGPSVIEGTGVTHLVYRVSSR